MKTLGNARLHFWRTLNMAKACHVDLTIALQDGKITQSEYSDMITGCRRCTDERACGKLLIKETSMYAPPDYCVNQAAFERIKAA